jgi:hypothetical protein
MKGRTFWIGLRVACSLMACNLVVCTGAVAQQPAAPPASYKIDEEYTRKSPDGAITIEQYQNKDDWTWQFWVRRQGTFAPLDPEPAGYPAGFRFTNDLKWVVRMQKTGAGEDLSVPRRSGRLRARDQEAAGRPGMGIFQEPSRVAKGQEGPGVSHFGGPPGGDREEL